MEQEPPHEWRKPYIKRYSGMADRRHSAISSSTTSASAIQIHIHFFQFQFCNA
jgi:hypothetical protein